MVAHNVMTGAWVILRPEAVIMVWRWQIVGLVKTVGDNIRVGVRMFFGMLSRQS